MRTQALALPGPVSYTHLDVYKRQVLDELVRGYDTGAVLRRGVQAAIVGSPNVGKSTLLNLLAVSYTHLVILNVSI